jgi:8-oxo-dGTP pyrophosphatase MutT (NUDIX family)
LLGYITDAVALAIQHLPHDLLGHVTINFSQRTISLAGTTPALRSDALASITAHWRAADIFTILKRWRNEQIGIYSGPGELYATVERAATPLFGITSYYVYLIAYINIDEEMRIWIQRRVKSKTHGGMLDCTVAGAVGVGERPAESLAREAAEEAGFSSEIIERAKPIDGGRPVLNLYLGPEELGSLCRSGCGWGFEVELKEGEEPRVVDGEAEGFYKLAVDNVKARLMSCEFMPNAAKVIIEWLAKQGKLEIEEMGNILERKFPFPLMGDKQ